MTRNAKWMRVLIGVGSLIVVLSLSVYILPRWRYLPKEPIKISRNFIDLIQAGDFEAAYKITDHGALVGRTLAIFEANMRRQLGVVAFPSHRATVFIGIRSGFQSYGNRLRRWFQGRKIDPDEIVIDYDVGLPFAVKLESDTKNRWRITFFESHAA